MSSHAAQSTQELLQRWASIWADALGDDVHLVPLRQFMLALARGDIVAPLPGSDPKPYLDRVVDLMSRYAQPSQRT